MEGSDLELVEQARAGNGDPFRALVDRHSRTIYRTAFRLTGNEQSAEDVVQEALLDMGRGDPDPEIRSQALFWLAQSEDPRALDLLTELLR